MLKRFALASAVAACFLAFAGCGDKSTSPKPVVEGTPSLVSPADAATGVSLTPTLMWNKTADATSYNLQVATTSAFTGTLAFDASVSDTFKILAALANATSYYWRVKAVGANGSSAYSAVRSFTTAAAAVPLDVWAIYTDTATTAKFDNGYNLYVWGSTGTFQVPPSEVKFGANTLDFVVGTVGWGGIGFQPMGPDIATGVDIHAYTKLHFWIKSTAASMSASLSSLDITGNAPSLPLTTYGYVADNAWHEINIPLADWTGVDLTKVNVYAGFVAASTTGGEHILLDDIWYAK